MGELLAKCTESSFSSHCKLSKMYAYSKFITPAARTVAVSRGMVRPLGSSMVKGTTNQEVPQNTCSITSYTALNGLNLTSRVDPITQLRGFQTSAAQRDIDQAAKYIGAGAGIGSVFGSLVIAYARNPSLKQQLFSYAAMGFALTEAMGLFCIIMAFLILFAF